MYEIKFILLLFIVSTLGINNKDQTLTCADFCHLDFANCIDVGKMEFCDCLAGVYVCEFRNNCTNPGDCSIMRGICKAAHCNWCNTLIKCFQNQDD